MKIEEIKELAFGHGFAFGKYTRQIILDEKLIAILDTNDKAMSQYMQSYNEGFNTGYADTVRYNNFDDDVYKPVESTNRH